MLIDSARLLRGIAFALARRDEKWLGQTGDAARRLLQRMSKDLRVPTLVHVDGYQSTAPFSLVAGDIVPKRTQIADRLRELVQSVLVRRQNVALHQPFHRAASAELAGSFRAIVRAYPSLAKKCLRLEVAGDLETAFFRELALAPRTNFADPPAGSAAGDGLVRHVLSELQTLEEFAERVAVAGLEVLGYPARDLRNYYDYARKRRAKRATLPIQRMLTRVLLEPPWALPSPRRMTRTPPP